MVRTAETPEQGTAKWFILAQLAQACERANLAQAEAEVAFKMREQAIRAAKRFGLSLSEIGALSGLSKSRVQQIVPGAEDDGEAVDESDLVRVVG